MLAGNGGQHGWANLTLLIFVSGWSRRLRPAACRAIGRRRNLAGVGVSTAINWVRRLRETGSVAPGQMGGHKPKSIAGAHRAWLLERTKEKDFTLRGLVAELAERGLKVDYRTVWSFVHAEKLSFKKNRGGWRTRPSRRGATAGAVGQVSEQDRA
jgi:transposase